MLDAVAELAPHSRTQQVAPQHAHDTLRQRLRTPSWCVVQSHPQAERRAHANLHIAGFNAYLPLITRRTPCRHWRTTALFPGYLFVQLDLSKPWHPVIRCPGVYCLVSFDGSPAPCPPGAVEAIQTALEQSGGELRPETPKPAVGALLAVSSGVLRDCHCVLLSHHNGTAKVAAMIAGHLCTVSVPLDCLRARDE